MTFAVFFTIGMLLMFAEYRRVRPSLQVAFKAFGVGVIVVTVVTFIFQNSAAQEREKEWSVAESQKIVSLANSSEDKGSGGIFVTRVSEENILRYVKDSGDEVYSLEEIPADDVTIHADVEAKDARIDFQECKRADTNPNSVFADCGSRTVVHIPKGSIANDFSIDPKD